MATTYYGVVFIVASLLMIDQGVGLRLQQEGSHKPYFWSSGRGSVGSYSASSYPVNVNISAQPTWSWHHPNGLWSTIPVGTSIDDQKNVYLTAADGIRKFSPDGQLLWAYTRRESGTYKWETITKVAALMDGAVYGITQKGRAFAVSMDTGRELWSTNVSRLGSDGNYGHVVADAGVVITAAEVSKKTNRRTPSCCGSMNHKVVGLSGADGSILWTYEPKIPVWNFGASFAGDGTFIFQSLDGTLYRNKVSDGTLVWKAGGVPESWTDGQANLGPNGIVYGVANYHMMGPNGCISAHRLSDGEMLWRHNLSTSPNAVPAVSRVAGYPGLSVVIPVGKNDAKGKRIDVYALDAETGRQRWVFKGPTQTVSRGAGDGRGAKPRSLNHVQGMTMPNSWGCTAIDGQGKVFVGGTTGHFFELQDADADGKVDGPGEVSVMRTPAAFVGSSGPAIAPGLLAIGNANSLFVWRY